MKNKIKEIRIALDSGAYLPALALSLTLPDICGQIEYPKYKAGKRYIDWYNKYVKPLHFIKDNDMPHSQFDGKMCYALRCAFLHSGNFELNQKKENDKMIQFNLHVSKNKTEYIICNRYCLNGNITIIDLDAYGICYYIAHAAQEFYFYHEDKRIFDKYDAVIIDNSQSNKLYDMLLKDK